MAHAIPVTLVDQNGNYVAAGGGGGGGTTVDLIKVGGVGIALGQDTDGTHSIPVVLPSGLALTVSGAVVASGTVSLGAGAAEIGHLTANQSVNMAQVSGTTASVNNGTVDAGTLRVTLASNGTGQVALASGSQIQPIPGTSGGLTMYHAVVPNNVTGVVVKNSAGQIYGITLANNSATLAFLKLYDSSSAPTAGAGTIKKILIVPGPSGGGGGGLVYSQPHGLAFASGIAYTFTTLIADADATVPAAATYSIDIDYK
jgi:hypothetical protein